MPTYGYECTACRNQVEVMQSIKDAPLTVCENCGGVLRKLIYPIGISFKGAGFYVNDYAPKSNGASAKSSEPASSGTSTDAAVPAKSEASTESKSEVKSETATAAATETKAPVSGAATS
jgi:putative FmdB family regulatory protein